MMFSCKYDTQMWNGFIHRKHASRLILAKVMVVMWYELLYHSRVKSIQIPTRLCKPDLRLNMYLWPFIENNQKKFGTTDGVAREYGGCLHCDILDTYMCKKNVMMRYVNVLIA